MIKVKVKDKIELAKAYIAIINLTLSEENRIYKKEADIIAYALNLNGNMFVGASYDDYLSKSGMGINSYLKYIISLRKKKWISDKNLNKGLLPLKKKLLDNEHVLTVNITLI